MAYTKYSLTPANNNAAPPDGAPEGMLPSAVNDTMRDMMAQIRDCGDGIRGGTYTMTAPVITGGSISGITSLSTTGNTTLGDASTDTLNVGNGGLVKDASGNVGIGGTSTGALLYLTQNGNTTAFISATNAGTNSAGLTLENAGQRNWNIWADRTGDQLRFGNDSRTITNVAINSPTGDTRLAVVATNAGTNSATLSLENAGQRNWQVWADRATDTFRIGNNTRATTNITINSSGNVGIGADSPGYKLDVRIASESALNIYNTTASSNDSVQSQISSFNGTYWNQLSSNASSHVWKTYNTERMRLTANGVVLINRTGQISTEYFGITFDGNSRGAFYPYSSTTNTSYHITFGNPNGAVGSIYTSGSATGYATSSDYRLKDNIAPMTGALAKVSALKPVTYTWKADGSHGEGFIAHELQEVVPDCVTGEKDAVETVDDVDAEGKKIGVKEVPRYQGIDTSFLVATLTAAIQEQQVMINELKAKVAALEAA